MSDMQPGFRFYPTEEELVSFYLRVRFEGGDSLNQVDRVIPVLDIYSFNPWQLPPVAGELCRADPEQWFFFVPRQARESRGGRPNRQTESGYWKATGSPGYVYSSANRIIGEKKTMVYYVGRAPSGKKTEWKMNEYRTAVDGEAANPDHGASLTFRKEYSVCRVYKKSKTVRAFDRRPTAAGIIIGGGGQAGQHRHYEPAAAEPRERSTTDGLQIDISHQITGSTNLSSPDSSSPSEDDGGDPHNLSHHEAESSNSMAIDSEPLWEWDNLKFF